jgi:hypothetical protein
MSQALFNSARETPSFDGVSIFAGHIGDPLQLATIASSIVLACA